MFVVHIYGTLDVVGNFYTFFLKYFLFEDTFGLALWVFAWKINYVSTHSKSNYADNHDLHGFIDYHNIFIVSHV